MAKKLYSRMVLEELTRETDPLDYVRHAIQAGLGALRSLEESIDWSTFKLVVDRDAEEVFAGRHVLTITALSKED